MPKHILMCPPTYYGIEYEINPWMSLKEKPEHNLVVQQWEVLYHTIQMCGAKVSLIQPAKGWPDMTFTANAGLYYQDKIILSHFKHAQRQGEIPFFVKWFEQQNIDIIYPNKKFFFEGAGDALLAGKTLFAGFNFRTDKHFYYNDIFDKKNIVYCELNDPYFYHIDTCFAPLSPTLAIWYPGAFTPQSQTDIQETIEVISVSKEEAQHFACNAVIIDQHIITTDKCPNIQLKLEKRGYTFHGINMSEFLKAGGSCKCLTLEINSI